jgi:hypothetical protein
MQHHHHVHDALLYKPPLRINPAPSRRAAQGAGLCLGAGRDVLDAAAESDNAESRGDNGYGEVFMLRFPMRTATGPAKVLTAWIVRRGEDFPRLTTCHP